MIYTPANVEHMVRLALGADQVGQGRASDIARKILDGRIDPPNPAAAAYLLQLQNEADEREARRVAAAHTRAIETATSWREFQDRRVAPSETPAGFRDLGVRDELSGQLLKLRVPIDWIIQT